MSEDVAWGDTGIGNRTAQYAPIFPAYRDGRHFFDAGKLNTYHILSLQIAEHFLFMLGAAIFGGRILGSKKFNTFC